MAISRRKFLGAGGAGLLTFYVSGCKVAMTPQQAKTQGADFQVLKSDHVDALEALGDVLVPGSSEQGIAHFIDHQLAASPQGELLMIKYLGVNPPFDGFYLAGLEGLEGASQASHGNRFADLTQDQQAALVAGIAQSNPEGWTGPPAPFFYFVLRGDAVDVVYGTPKGFDKLKVPYMPHIEPPQGWRT